MTNGLKKIERRNSRNHQEFRRLCDLEFPFRGKEETESWFTPQFRIKNGMIGIPSGEGLGVEIDPAYLAKAKKVEMP